MDGTLTTMDSVLAVFNRETGKDLSLEDIIEYDVGKCFGMSGSEGGDIWKNFSGEIFSRSIAIWNIHEFMEQWRTYQTSKKNKNMIVIVTARPEEYRQITEDWLKSNAVEYDEIYFGFNRKLDAVQEHFLDVLVDDKADNIQDIDRNNFVNCEAFLVDRPYNYWYGTPNRIYVEGTPKGVI